MALYPNEARNERTGHEKGGSKGEQGAHGTGKVMCSSDGGEKPAASFKPAADVIGEKIVGELEIPSSISIVKGDSGVDFGGIVKGSEGKPLGGGGAVKKPKNAVDSGY